jgi:NADH:ubiquinone oxidoreductase subunit F (NADH-binding)/(2Fe-2S) ferredoxin/Pyruvate/2-oxoacid:ferredoxin oxidoreductase delta subunit
MAAILENYGRLYGQAEQAIAAQEANDQILIQVGSATCELTAGADRVREEFRKLINASGRQDIQLKRVGCTGRCAREPVVGVFCPGQIPVKYERLTPDKVQTVFQQHVLGGSPVPELILDKKTSKLYDYVVTLCSSDRCCHDGGSVLEETLRGELAKQGIAASAVLIKHSGCMGLCEANAEQPQHYMMVFPQRIIYRFSTDEDLARIVASQFKDGQIVDEFVTHADYVIEEFLKQYGDVSFFNRQTRLTLRNSGLIDPESLFDYVHKRGYHALAQVLDRNDPGWVIEQVTASGLRGRGGGGYPTGTKWKNATGAEDTQRYVVCNADEGDPGAFMDRSALEGDPFTIIEGMTIGAFAIGASQGYLYVRAEYPLAIKRLENAIQLARENGLLGKNIMGSDFDFEVSIRLGAGAFVCGEETALLISIEGKRGQPRMRPPYPTQKGLWGHPTVINNVETWANVPAILLFGAAWFSNFGTDTSKGTKVFALAGKVQNTGLVEVPMGTPLREIIYDIGGGVPDGRELKAVQTGGPSGGCIPAHKIDTPVDYEHLQALGSIMGSGGMIVLDDQDCMVATAKFFLDFTQDESCGKCVPCREGTLRMYEILDRITKGQACLSDLDTLERLARLVQRTSLCGLGQAAPNPVLSALENFREEFEIHIEQGRCPAHKCQDLLQFSIDTEKCVGCTLCARRCPVGCIGGQARSAHVIDQDRCIKCGECFNACKFAAVTKQ